MGPVTQNTVSCTQCGGENPLPSGSRLVECQYCDARLFVDRSGVISHYRLPPLLSADQARAALRRWMAGNDTVKGLDRKSTIGEIAAVSFPMWLFRVRQPGGEEVFVEPAAPTPIPQLADLRLPAGELEPYRTEEDGVEAVQATIPLETARGWLEQRRVSNVTESALVQVPLWRARYSFRGQDFQALIDGATGQVLAAVYPEKAESPYYLVAALGLVLFGLEGLLIPSPFAKLLAYAFTAIPLTTLAYWVTRKV